MKESISVYTTQNVQSTRPYNHEEWTLEDFYNLCLNPRSTKRGMAYIPAELRGGIRKASHVISRTALTIDVDYDGAYGFEKLTELLDGYEYVWHTSYSSTPEKPRYRFFVPLSEPVTPLQYHSALTRLIEKVGGEEQNCIDGASRNPAQVMFAPATANPTEYACAYVEGRVLDPEGHEWFAPPEGSSLNRSMGRVRKTNPMSLKGVTGEFCRAYGDDLDALIADYELPYIAIGDKWLYAESHSAPGMVHIAGREGLWYSFHETDPAKGAQNAFDLVRIHKFGHLDEGVDPKITPNKRPSAVATRQVIVDSPRMENARFNDSFGKLEAMSESVKPLASSTSPQGVPQVAAEESTPAQHSMEWVKQLTRNTKTGKVEDTSHNLTLIFENDPALKSLKKSARGKFKFFTSSVPWRAMNSRYDQNFQESDWGSVLVHIENYYDLKLSRQRLYDMIDAYTASRVVDPVVEYLKGLQWDGTPRLETSLPGVVPTDYTRQVARKAFVGAVARAFSPGVKVDLSLMIYGGQGNGKSLWISKMARGFDAVLGDPTYKDTLVTASRSWIMVSDEGAAMSKADFNHLKEFMTRTVDVYRPPYGRETESVPRSWVIWGTTNDAQMLRKRDGNRRFMIVTSEHKVDFEALTDEYIDQVWAEAVHLYQAGEPLYWEGEEESSTAEEELKRYTRGDPWEVAVTETLEALVPEDWEELTSDQRVQYTQIRKAGMPVDTSNAAKRRRVNIVELWTEALGAPISRLSLADTQRLSDIMLSQPGWSPAHTREDGTPYPSGTFIRVE